MMIQLKKKQITVQPNDNKTNNTVEKRINNSISNDKKSVNRKKVGRGVDNKFVIITYTVRVCYL